MSFHDALARDLAQIAGDTLGPAEDVLLVPGTFGGPADWAGPMAEEPEVRVAIRAFFEAVSVDVAPGAIHAPVLSTAPTLHIEERVLAATLGRELGRRDQFLVRGKRYAAQAPRTDGFGLVTVKLTEVDNAANP